MLRQTTAFLLGQMANIAYFFINIQFDSITVISSSLRNLKNLIKCLVYVNKMFNATVLILFYVQLSVCRREDRMIYEGPSFLVVV
jgi:hypothetical protein